MRRGDVFVEESGDGFEVGGVGVRGERDGELGGGNAAVEGLDFCGADAGVADEEELGFGCGCGEGGGEVEVLAHEETHGEEAAATFVGDAVVDVGIGIVEDEGGDLGLGSRLAWRRRRRRGPGRRG